MKNILFTFFLLGEFIGCTNAQEHTTADSTKVEIRFFESEETLDFSWETAWVDTLLAQIKRGTSGLKDADSTCFPVNREQLIKLLKYSKIANSRQGIGYVYVDLASGKIIDLTSKLIGKEYIQLGYEEFLKRWQAEEIVLKLIKKEDLPATSYTSTALASKSGDDELMTGEQGRRLLIAEGSCSVLSGRTTLHTQVHWYTGQALPGYTTTDTIPSVKNSFSRISPLIRDGFHEGAATFIYNPTTRQLEGCIGGYVIVSLGTAGKEVKITEGITVHVFINMDNRITCFSND